MPLLCIKTHDLTWQDRTLNTEIMMAPLRCQLLYNKHKGLGTKYLQENAYLERAKVTFLRSYSTEKRLMERKRDIYARSKTEIRLRGSSGDSRKRGSPTDSRSSEAGRKSAPPRLQSDRGGKTTPDKSVNTPVRERDVKSAFLTNSSRDRSPRTPSQTLLITPIQMQASNPPGNHKTITSFPQAAVGRPHFQRTFQRQKSVRFQSQDTAAPPRDTGEDKDTVETIDDRIKRFIDTQDDFNNRKPHKVDMTSLPSQSKRASLAKRHSNLTLNMKELETAFDNFVAESSDEGLHRLVKYASKMKASVRIARDRSFVPALATLRSKNMFKRHNMSPSNIEIV